MNEYHIAQSSADVREEYSERQRALEAAAASSKQRSRRAVAACIISLVLLALSFFLPVGLHVFIAVTFPVLTLAAFWQIRAYLRHRGRVADAAFRAAFYERGIDRIDGNWLGKGNAGLDFERDHHLYQNDLDILGKGSIFELLATTRSGIGAERLAAFLLDPVTSAEARARQEAVKELQPAVDLREEIDALGKYRFQDCSGKRLRGWLDEPLIRVPKVLPAILALLSMFSVALVAAGCARLYSWVEVVEALGFSLSVQGAIALVLTRDVRARIQVLRTLGGDVSVLRAGIDLLAPMNFHSPKLCGISECLSAQDAGKTLHALQRLLTILEHREDEALYGFLILFAAGTQLVLGIERWRARHQAAFEGWLDAWAEFEALSALAGYAYEHPGDAYPDLLDGKAYFKALEMGHPLLSERICVTNDVALDASTRFYIVSGSNMAGKSTLLRAIGLNAVLAAAGAPVRAMQARMAAMTVCASISVGDSLRDGTSKFLAEVERLRDSILKARRGEPVLFLIDEMLAGTNSRDRSLAAGWMLEALIAAGAVGALSTHDLALTEIAEREGLHGANVYMQSRKHDDPLDFDYRLRPGIASQTNGMAIVRMIGLQV